ncbi:MAG: DUF433 domain-containing protein [Fimbriimonadales bacterium]
MPNKTLLERITSDPRILAGQPVLRGTRLSVAYILRLLASGATVDEILQEYEGLTAEDVQACLLFAAETLENIACSRPTAYP